VDHDLTGKLGDERFEFVGFESLEPANHPVFPPPHTSTVGVGIVAGIEGGAVGAHISRAYKYHTHGFLVG
jgi:hypothetical protein